MKLKGKASNAGIINTMASSNDATDAIEEGSEGEGSEEGNDDHTESVSSEEGFGTSGSVPAIQARHSGAATTSSGQE